MRAELEACDRWSVQGQMWIRVLQMATLPLNLGRNLFPVRRFSYRPAIQRVQATNGCCVTLHLPGVISNRHQIVLAPGPFVGCSRNPPLGRDQVNVLLLRMGLVASGTPLSRY
jgi:hypothetical protein